MAEFTELETRLFINGEFTPSICGKTFKLVNPATDKLVTEVYKARVEDVELAVQSSRTAFPRGLKLISVPGIRIFDLIYHHGSGNNKVYVSYKLQTIRL